MVKHSGAEKQVVRIEKSGTGVRGTAIMSKSKPNDNPFSEEQNSKKLVLRIVVKNARGEKDNEIGDARIELDDLIDVNLRDLAKEYVAPLNRSYLLKDK